jgi:DNA-binding SARP family transcriptional activator
VHVTAARHATVTGPDVEWAATGVTGGPRQHLTVRLLGAVQVHDGRRWTETGGTKQRTVLAALLLARGAGVPVSRLARLLWSDHPPETAQAQIQTYVYKLRKIGGLSQALVRQGTGYALHLGPHDVLDLLEFEHQTSQARAALAQGHGSEAARLLQEALALWRGPALADVTEDLQKIEQPRLEELRLAAIEDRVDAELASHQPGKVIPELTGLVAEHPLRERLRGQLMLALHRCGRQAEALHVYRTGRRLLREHSGLDPGEKLAHIHKRILADIPGRPPVAITADSGGDPRQAPSGAQALGVAETAASPAQLPPAGLVPVGRAKEIAQARDHLVVDPGLQASRPVPVCLITGMAGVGKSMLAVHVARDLRDRYPDGQLYADLRDADARQDSVAEVLGGFLQALGVDVASLPAHASERIALYRSKVADRKILVVLDNAPNGTVVRPLLPSGASCAAIVTSPSRMLAIEGAEIVDLVPLECERAVELLARLTGESRVGAEPHSAEAIARHCGGLPLAIGIAGARLAARPHWPLSRLASRLADELTVLDELSLEDTAVRDRLARRGPRLGDDMLATWHALSCLDVPCFEPWVAVVLLGVPEARAEDLVDRLADERLLEVAGCGHGSAPYYRFHALLRTAAREQARQSMPDAARRSSLGQLFGSWLALAREAEGRLAGDGRGQPVAGRPRRLPAGVDVDRLLADPRGWFERERPVLSAVVTQAHGEKRGVLASELAQVITRLERVPGPASRGRRPGAAQLSSRHFALLAV